MGILGLIKAPRLGVWLRERPLAEPPRALRNRTARKLGIRGETL